jgi:hypothetical protein
LRIRKNDLIVIGQFAGQPEPLGATRGEAGEADILELIAAQPLSIEMRKNRIAAGIDPIAAGKPFKLKQ